MSNANTNLFKMIGNSLIDDSDTLKVYLFNFYKGFPYTYEYIANHKFISDSKKVTIINIFFKIRKIYDTLNSFAKHLKIKFARETSVTTDLCLNNLDNYPDHLKMVIIQNERKYIFRLSDMMQLWKNSLTNSITFSPAPELPKNPYTNIKFNTAVFANSYIKLKKTSYTIPIILEFFWQSSMDVCKFELDAYTLLKEYSVSNYIEETCDTILFYDVINMLSSLGHDINYRTIHNDFYSRKSYIVKNMKQYLKPFLLSQESCNKFKRRMFRRKSIIGLKAFFNVNPIFGRRIVCRGTNQVIHNQVISVDNNIPSSEVSSDLDSDNNSNDSNILAVEINALNEQNDDDSDDSDDIDDSDTSE
jgi:hypothetical protein